MLGCIVELTSIRPGHYLPLARERSRFRSNPIRQRVILITMFCIGVVICVAERVMCGTSRSILALGTFPVRSLRCAFIFSSLHENQGAVPFSSSRFSSKPPSALSVAAFLAAILSSANSSQRLHPVHQRQIDKLLRTIEPQ